MNHTYCSRVIMELFYCTGLHILLVIAMGANTLLFKSVDANFITGPWIGQKDVEDVSRTRRAVLDFGIKSALDGVKATAVILRGSTEIVSVTPNTRKFLKPGTYKTAVTDFFSVNPSNTRDFTRSGGVKGKIGTIGDRTITVETKEGTSIGTLTILKRKMRDGKSAKEIIYTDFKTYPMYKKLEVDGEHISL